jgi:hypothetical protein
MCAPLGNLHSDTVSYGKHIKATKRTWDRSIARALSAAPRSAAQYNPYLRNNILVIEMKCAQCEAGEFQGEYSQSIHFLYTHDEDIGVSGGERTRHILVSVNKSTGSVHGYPIPESEFQERKRTAQQRKCNP